MNQPEQDIRSFRPGEPRFMIDLASVRRFLDEKDRQREKELDIRFEKITADCARIIAYIASHFAVKRIYQWGSLLDRKRFSEISDIDIALEGVRSYRDFSSILGEVESMTDFPLDIVDITKVGEENARTIRDTGKVVYEQN